MPAPDLAIRQAIPSDAANPVNFITELQDHEQALHDICLPGASIAEPYLRWLESRTAGSGAILIGEVAGRFVGFVAGWIEETSAPLSSLLQAPCVHLAHGLRISKRRRERGHPHPPGS